VGPFCLQDLIEVFWKGKRSGNWKKLGREIFPKKIQRRIIRRVLPNWILKMMKVKKIPNGRRDS